MGRPSLVAQRRFEILTAVGRCVARHGVADTTLEQVSEESGLSRGHVRHYLGNRDELILAFADHVFDAYRTTLDEARSTAPEGEQSKALLGILFGHPWEPSEDNPAIDALLSASATDKALAARMRFAYLGIESRMAKALRADYPSAPSAACTQTAYALISMAFGNSTLSQLGFPANRRKAVRAMAEVLVEQVRIPQRQGGKTPS